MGQTVLVVDDHADFRSAARSLLEAEGFEVVGEAATGADALVASARLRPDVVLLDIRLPDTDGLSVAELLAGAATRPRSSSCRAGTPASTAPGCGRRRRGASWSRPS